MHPLHINTNLISFSSWILKVDNATNDTDEEIFVFLCMQNYNLCFGLYNYVTGVLLSAFPSRYPHTCVKETLTERQKLIWYYRLEQFPKVQRRNRPQITMKILFRCFHLFLFTLAVTSPVCGDNFTLGLLVPFDGLRASAKLFAPAIVTAVDDINNSSDLLSGHHLSYIWNDTECNEDKSLQAMAHQIHERRVSAIIGPGCTCQYEARYASVLDVAMISYVSLVKWLGARCSKGPVT